MRIKGDHMITDNQENKGILLSSPEPLDDGLRKYNKLYYMFFITGAFISFINRNSFPEIIGAGIFFCLIALGVKSTIAGSKLHKLRRLEFQLPYEIEYEKLMLYITLPLTQLNMKVEKDTNGQPCITDKGVIYDIIIDNENTVFTIWWRLSIPKVFSFASNITYYRKAVVSMGIIGYMIQQEMMKNQKATN